MEFWNWVFTGSREFYTRRLSILANDMQTEKWSSSGRDDYSILNSYIRFTFEKLYSEMEDANPENKNEYIFMNDDVACFNTGLYTKHWEPIYFFAEKNDREDRQPWKFTQFYYLFRLTSTEPRIPAAAVDRLRRANYFSNPADLIFDINLKIVPQWDHILDDEKNFLRIPASIRIDGKDSCRRSIESAIADTQRRIEANYKTVVPQYYKGRNDGKGRIQLLAPLYLTNREKPDLALVLRLSDDKSQYLGHTCLTTEMAYNNARLIARPDSDWLLP